MSVLGPDGNELLSCSTWLDISNEEDVDIPPFDCIPDAGCQVECGKGEDPNSTPYDEYVGSIPWNYTYSPSFITDCSDSWNDRYKIMYDSGEYISTYGVNRLASAAPFVDAPQQLQMIVHKTNSCPGHQFRTTEHEYIYLYSEWDEDFQETRLYYNKVTRFFFTYWVFLLDSFTPPTGWDWDENKNLTPICGSEFEILHNVEFSSLVSEVEATSWTSTGIVFNGTSLSDYTGNVAHFGDTPCEILSQPITIDNGEYRYNPTMLYGIQISYIDIRNAKSDSTLVINVGGDVDVYDLERIRNKFPLGNSGVTDVYAFQTGEEIFTIEKPVTSVNPGLYAVAEIWQFGDIILEVAKYGITGYIPCEKILTDEDAIVSGLSCAEDDDITEYLWKQDLYRRKIVTFDTDIQGLVPQYLDKILVSHSALQWGEAGEVVALVGDDGILLSDELVDTVSSKTIVFRNIDGSISGAYGAIVTDGYNIEVYGKPDWVKEKTLYTIQDINSAQEFLVTSVVPNGNIVKIECVEYVEEIYK